MSKVWSNKINKTVKKKKRIPALLVIKYINKIIAVLKSFFLTCGIQYKVISCYIVNILYIDAMLLLSKKVKLSDT